MKNVSIILVVLLVVVMVFVGLYTFYYEPLQISLLRRQRDYEDALQYMRDNPQKPPYTRKELKISAWRWNEYKTKLQKVTERQIRLKQYAMVFSIKLLLFLVPITLGAAYTGAWLLKTRARKGVFGVVIALLVLVGFFTTYYYTTFKDLRLDQALHGLGTVLSHYRFVRSPLGTKEAEDLWAKAQECEDGEWAVIDEERKNIRHTSFIGSMLFIFTASASILLIYGVGWLLKGEGEPQRTRNILREKRKMKPQDLRFFEREADKYKKSITMTWFLWLFGGLFGFHRFYLEHIEAGIHRIAFTGAALTGLYCCFPFDDYLPDTVEIWFIAISIIALLIVGAGFTAVFLIKDMMLLTQYVSEANEAIEVKLLDRAFSKEG